MSETVVGTIANFVGAFTPNPIPALGSKVKLDDPFIAAFDRLRQIEEDQKDATIERAFYLYTEERHYSHNISTLLYYFLYYLSNYRNDERVHWDFYSRLTLDIEQLLTNTRSFLDSTYQLALLFSDERSRIPGRRQKSFGKFAEWADQEGGKMFDPGDSQSEGCVTIISTGAARRRLFGALMMCSFIRIYPLEKLDQCLISFIDQSRLRKQQTRSISPST